MKYIYFLLLCFILYGCSASNENNTGDKTQINPCKDSLYLALRVEPPGILTDQQKQYIKEKEKECADYRATQEEKTKKEKDSNPNAALSIALGVAMVIVLLLTYIAFSSAHN
jgi:hypothetical protein